MSRQPSAISLQLALLLLATPCRAQSDMGASVSVTVDEKGDTTLEVKRGDVKVKSGGQEVRASAGETLQAKKGKKLARSLPAPTVTAPAADATVNVRDVGFAWQKVPGAAKYLLEIAAAPEMGAARTQTVEGVRATVHLDAGTWYWRVVALDADATPGKRALPRRLTIDVTPPKLKTGKPEWK